MKKVLNYFTKFEIGLWMISVLSIVISFFVLRQTDYLTLTASVVGATFLIFNAKGNPIGQFLTIVFSILYGIISYRCSYYGEMITYLCMSMPMACFALISWLKNPYKNNKSEVKINQISKTDVVVMMLLTAVVTILFYFILKYSNTANLIPSTLSVSTTFIAVYLTFKRSSYFALAYAFNDAVLIILWILVSIEDTAYLSVVICFIVFLVNDLYGFVNWIKMEKNKICKKLADYNIG